MLSSKKLYEKVDKLRIKKGLSYAGLTHLAGISHGTLYSWKTRGSYPTLEVLEGIAIALDIPLAELLFDVDFKNLSPDEVELLSYWNGLNDEQKKAIVAMIKTMR